MFSNAVKLDYDPSWFGVSVELRGIVLNGILVLVWKCLAMRGLRLPSMPLVFAVIGLLALSALTGLQLVWVTIPCLIAIWTYSAVLKSNDLDRTAMTPQPTRS